MRPVKRQSSRSVSTASPIGGLNARDALAAMPPLDAVTLDNFFPTPTSVELRKGRQDWATGLPADVETLMTYTSATTYKGFAGSGTAIYDITTQGAVGAAVVSGLTNVRFQYQNYGTTGGQFLYAVNGADPALIYNGTAWQSVTAVSAPIAITGVTTSTLIAVNEYRNRLFFVQKDSFSVWYLPVNSVGGAASLLDLSPIFKLGGYLMGMMTWTVDNASGVNEYAVFMSSEGEAVMYLGTDPSVAGNFTIMGKFRMGRPIGRRFYERMGSDVIMVTEDGIFPLSKALLTDRSQLQDAISDKIVNLISTDAQSYGSNFGWDIILYPTGNKLIINVPQNQGAIQYQYVMNTITGAWCRFTKWNANCFTTINNQLFFGGNLGTSANSATVSIADYGMSDNGAYIFGEVKTSFRYFDAPGLLKRFTMVRPIFQTSGNMTAALAIDVDFEDNFPKSVPTFSGVVGTAWGTGAWDTFPWSDNSSIKKNWQGVSGIGYAAALHMRIVNNASPVQWQAVDYVFETGGIL